MSEPVTSVKISTNGILGTLVSSIKFSIVSHAISVILLAILALVLVYTPFPESYSPLCINGIIIFSAFLTALLSASKQSCRGWICGIISGFVNILILLIAGMAAFGSGLFGASAVRLFLTGIVSGLVGGIIGVNFSQK